MRLKFNVSSSSVHGQRSEQNDRVLTAPFPGGLLAAVMDGVGKGPGAGEAASDVSEVLEAQALGVGTMPGWLPGYEQPMHLDMAMVLARDALAAVEGATTCTALVLHDDGQAVAAHCGDTALFRWRQGKLVLMTTPHRASRHMLTHALHGYGPAPHRATAEWDLLTLEDAEPGDVYLLASDGCYEFVTHALLRAALAQAHLCRGLPEMNVAGGLVQVSLAGGSTDNSSAIVVHVEAA